MGSRGTRDHAVPGPPPAAILTAVLLAGCSSPTEQSEVARVPSPDGRWVAVSDYLSGWGVSAYRVRLVANPPLTVGPARDAGIVLCPWNSVHHPIMEWNGARELRIRAWGSPAAHGRLNAWHDVRVVYDLWNR